MSPSKIVLHSNVTKYREIIPDTESQSIPSLSPKFCSETTLQLTSTSSTLMPTASSLSQSSIPPSHYNNYTCTLCGKLLKSKATLKNHKNKFHKFNRLGHARFPDRRYTDRRYTDTVIPTGHYTDRTLYRQDVIPTGRYTDN